MAVRSQLSGFKEAREVLQELGRTVQRNVGRRALVPAAEVVASAVRSKAAVSGRANDPTRGSLRASVKVVPAKSEKGGPRVAVLAEDPAAVPNEFGTHKMAAQPFFRTAADSARSAAARVFGTALKPEIERAAARAAQRGLKQ